MKYRIENYINHISGGYPNEDGNFIHGDGICDFEEHSNKTTKECLIDYISRCEKQIEIAELLWKDCD